MPISLAKMRLNAFIIKLEDILKSKEFKQYGVKDQKKELKPVAGFQYRICYTRTMKEGRGL